MRFSPRLLALLAVSLMFGGACTTWQAGDGSIHAEKKDGYTFVQSEGWYRSPFKARGFLTLTKDGPDLQYISVGRRKHRNAFKEIDKDSSASNLPQDLANDYMANTKALLGIDIIELIDNSPAEVGGYPGFKLEMAYRNSEGLRYKERIYGAATKNGLYLIEYRAPVLHYYDRDLSEFETTRQTFKIVPIEK